MNTKRCKAKAAGSINLYAPDCLLDFIFPFINAFFIAILYARQVLNSTNQENVHGNI